VFCQSPEEYSTKRQLLLQNVIDKEIKTSRNEKRVILYGGMVCGFFVAMHAYNQLMDTESRNNTLFGQWTNKLMNATTVLGQLIGTEKMSREVSEFCVGLLYASVLFGVTTVSGTLVGQTRALTWKKEVVDTRRERIYTLVAESDDSGDSDVDTGEN